MISLFQKLLQSAFSLFEKIFFCRFKNPPKTLTNTTTMTESKCPMSGAVGKCPFAAAMDASKAPTSYPNAAKLNKDGVVTNLDVKRSSDGMGLPAEMSQATIDMIVATAPAVAPKMHEITKNFYSRVVGKHPELMQYFNMAVRLEKKQ